MPPKAGTEASCGMWPCGSWARLLLVVTGTRRSPGRKSGIPQITGLKGHSAAGGTCRAQWDVPSLSFMHFPAFGHMGSAGGAQGSDNSHLPRSSSHLLLTSSAKPRGSSPPHGPGGCIPTSPWKAGMGFHSALNLI